MKREEILAVLTNHAKLWEGRGDIGYAGDLIAIRGVIASALDDAERYRWLRDNCFINRPDARETPHAVIAVCVGPFQNGIGWMHPGHTSGVGIPSLDTAVDTARAAAAGGEGVL